MGNSPGGVSSSDVALEMAAGRVSAGVKHYRGGDSPGGRIVRFRAVTWHPKGPRMVFTVGNGAGDTVEVGRDVFWVGKLTSGW